MISKRALVMAALGGAALAAHADYSVSLGSQNAPVQVVAPGAQFELDLVVASDRDDRNNAVIVRVEFSAPGLILESYEWFAPYGTGDGNDDSKPRLSQLPLALSANTLSGPGYPSGVVDLELSNVTGLLPGFSSGRLVKMVLKVPTPYAGPRVIRVRPVPDTVARGFDVIPTQVDQDFYLVVAQPPGTEPRLDLLMFDRVAIVFWPATAGSYRLESTTNVADPAGWSLVPQPLFAVGGRQAVISPAPAAAQFFRLRRP